ncbi:hypothetical protein FACS1894178_8060 [Bacteroidia bacterium]|nr:hypothetical protein FACS1894178_8060 [Bacteroidia bacterium]
MTILMKIDAIRNILEKQSIEKKIDFLATYDFKNDIKNQRYFIDFIKKNSRPRNDWYMMWLIDTAALLEIKDINLMNQYLSCLYYPNNYLLKLTILDYVSYTYYLYKTDNIDYSGIRQLLNNKNDRVIVKNTALLTLILLFPIEREIYMQHIIKNLSYSSKYQEVIRIFSFFLNRLTDEYIPKSYILELIKIVKSKAIYKLKSVQSIIEETQIVLQIDG